VTQTRWMPSKSSSNQNKSAEMNLICACASGYCFRRSRFSSTLSRTYVANLLRRLSTLTSPFPPHSHRPSLTGTGPAPRAALLFTHRQEICRFVCSATETVPFTKNTGQPPCSSQDNSLSDRILIASSSGTNWSATSAILLARTQNMGTHYCKM
jgi:hypothetical protein